TAARPQHDTDRWPAPPPGVPASGISVSVRQAPGRWSRTSRRWPGAGAAAPGADAATSDARWERMRRR
ncbi:hypothetical protein ACLQ3H_29755, partial [Micromonospora saelicesensis]|uniref:hypothetical protein n=1 Tax=Micromonospora saelicesensis TaxID=285676 RepID=UPI003CE8FA97